MAYHLLPKDEREKRDLRIVRLMELGVTQSDIARAVGLSSDYISTLLIRRRKRGELGELKIEKNNQVGVSRPRGLWMRSSLDGIY